MAMKIFVKTLKGTKFEIEVEPQQTVADVKQIIESAQGADVYPASRQMLIHKGKVLSDDTTLEKNQVAENSFLVIMLNKNKSPPNEGSSTQAAAAIHQTEPTRASLQTQTSRLIWPSHLEPPHRWTTTESDEWPAPHPDGVTRHSGEVATIEMIQAATFGPGGGSWDRDTVRHALRAASNDPIRAMNDLEARARSMNSLYSGIPNQAAQVPPSQGPNTNPLNLFPREYLSMAPNGNMLDILNLPSVDADAGADEDEDDDNDDDVDFRNDPQFESLRRVMEENPANMMLMLQELGQQNPELAQMVQGHEHELLSMMNEPDGVEEELEVSFTNEELQGIDRLEALGFERNHVLQVYLACNRNEELAANYLLDHRDDS